MAKGRKILYDPDKVKELRMKIIMDSLLVFSDDPKDKKHVKKWGDYRKRLLEKYASRVLPTLIAGKDDDKDLIPTPIYGGKSVKVSRHDSDTEAV